MLSIQPFTAQTGGDKRATDDRHTTGRHRHGGWQTHARVSAHRTAEQWCAVAGQHVGGITAAARQPLTAAAIAASTQGSVDLLGSGTLTFGVSGGAATISPLTALHSYSALVVALTNFSGRVPVGSRNRSGVPQRRDADRIPLPKSEPHTEAL